MAVKETIKRVGNALSQALLAGGESLTGQPFYTANVANRTRMAELEAERAFREYQLANNMAELGFSPTSSAQYTPQELSGMPLDKFNQLMPQGIMQGQGLPQKPNIINIGGKLFENNPQIMANLRSLKPNLLGEGIQETASSIADAIASGDQPPDMKGLYRYGGAVRGELAKRGFDMTKAQRDWLAVNKTISGLNSTQQVRMRQALDSVEKSIPALTDLSDQLQRSGLKAVNWLTINAALQGVGKQRDLATKYIGQINLMKDELAQGFMGGGVPTDRAFKLADDILQPLYGKGQMAESLNQLKYNLKIRKTAIQGITPLGIGGEVDNPKMTGVTTSSEGGTQTFKVGGKTYTIPADKVEAFKKAKGIK